MNASTLDPLLDTVEEAKTGLFTIAPSSFEPSIGPIHPTLGQDLPDHSTRTHYSPLVEPQRPFLQRQEVNSSGTSNWDVRKRYEGVVISVSQDRIHARFKEESDDLIEVDSEIPIREIPETQREFLREGSFLVWMIGYVTDKLGTKRRNSEFYIRRILRPSSYGVELSKEISTIVSAIDWE